MNPILRGILAIIAGIIIGSLVNMGLVMVGSVVIPAPDGADVTTTEGLKASVHLFEPKHFIFPFLAHALGTFTGAFTAAKIAARYKTGFALGVGCFFLIGGIASIFMIPAPVWYIVLDLLAAYLPMAYLAGKWASQKKIIAKKPLL